MSTQNSINEEYNEEYFENSEGFSSYNLLKVEYEKCKQEIYDLKRKLQLNETMLREVQETNELLERSLDRRISEKEQIVSEVEEKHRILAKGYENTITNLETKLAKQTEENEELRQRINCNVKTECISTIDQSVNLSFEMDNISLRSRIDELLSVLREEREKHERAEELIKKLKTRCNDYEYYIRGIKEQLDEKNQILEEVRAELSLRRTEITSLQMDPTCNSIFGEVEDRRRNVVNKMNLLREKYTEIKRICKTQITEIKMLRAERVATLTKLENDTDHTLAENEDLIQKYKSRISDLETKLKSEIKKNDDSKHLNDTNTSFRYFQSLLDDKKKEADELRIKVEDLYTKLLVQEETKMNITKQLRYWRCKASSLEAQICALQAELKLDLMNDAEHEILKELEDFTHEHNDDTANNEKHSIYKQRPDNPAQSLSLNCSSKTSLIKYPDNNKTQEQLIDKEKSNQSGTVQFTNYKY
ncbi:hypothetical protein WN48_05572 [Eufriesea mexicana]|uniref:Protein Spindly n=1 Tax=Eufriesea mexicana TaxID=516756 RepID=A0A310SMT6_9HYME|nr:hypothetical protein WN48_05572 [Eufriesea mexicana]